MILYYNQLYWCGNMLYHWCRIGSMSYMFKNMSTLLLLVVSTAWYTCADNVFLLQISNGKCFSTNRIYLNTTSPSALHCAVICKNDEQCFRLSYDSSRNNCLLQRETIDEGQQMVVPKTNWMFTYTFVIAKGI